MQIECKRQILTAGAAAWALLFVIAPCIARSDVAALRQHINQGNEYLRAGHCQQALNEYEKALAIDPTNAVAKANIAAAHNTWGIAYYRQHKYKDALREWQLSLKANPKNSNAKGNIALMQRMLEQQGLSLESEEAVPSNSMSEELVGADAVGHPAVTKITPQAGALGNVNAYPGDAAGAPESAPADEPTAEKPRDNREEKAVLSPASDSGDYGAAVIMNLPDKAKRSAAPSMAPNTVANPAAAAPAPVRLSNTDPSFQQGVLVTPNLTPPQQQEPAAQISAPPVAPAPPAAAAEPLTSKAKAGSLQDTLAALEMKIDGKLHNDMSLEARIQHIEELVGGTTRQGTMIDRVEALRREVGL